MGRRSTTADDVNHHLLANLRSARLVIADFTLQRPGVHFEAGFALGLGRTVIGHAEKTISSASTLTRGSTTTSLGALPKNSDAG